MTAGAAGVTDVTPFLMVAMTAEDLPDRIGLGI